MTPHPIFEIDLTGEGENYLGGEPPAGFNMPKFEFNAPFQYLGKLSKSDEAFNWLPFDLHLIAPIYLNIWNFFIDYSDPNNPKVFDLEGLKETGTAYEDLKPDSEIIFKKESFKAKRVTDFGNGVGHTGSPNWIQYPRIPSCPKSGKTMRFLCQLSEGPYTDRTNIHPKEEWYKQYFEYMNFWGDGDLFIFFEPESKIACFIIQNT